MARPSGVSFREALCLALVFLVPVFFFRGTQEIFEVPKVALLVTGALALAAGALAALLGDVARRGPAALAESAGRLATRAKQDPLGAAVLLYLASCVLSTIVAPNPAQSIYGAPESTAGLRTALATAVVFFAIRSLRGTPERFDRIARAASLAAIVAALYGALQAVGADPLEWGRTARYGAELRVFGTFGHPNFLGASLAMSVPLILHCRSRATEVVSRLAWTAGLLLAVAVLAATLSRGAWLGFGAGLLSWPALSTLARWGSRPDAPRETPARPRRRVWILAGASLLTLGLVGALAMSSPLGRALASRFGEIANPQAATTQTRVHIWAAGLRMAATRPWTGVGLDAFGTVFPAHRTAAYWRLEWGATPVKAHNEAVEILATQGWLGALAALLVVGLVAALLWRVLRARSRETRRCAVALGAALVAFLVQDLASFTVVGLGVPVAALAAWLAAAVEEERRAGAAVDDRPRPAPVWAYVLAVVLAVAAFVPLVMEPWRAEAAARKAATMPERSEAQARWWAEAERHAPWDARYPAQRAFLWYRRAQDEPDSTARRALLGRARLAADRATRLEPQSGSYATNLGEIEVEQSLLAPPDADVEQADAQLHRAAAVDSANGQSLDRIGFALARLGRGGEAHAVATRLARLYPDLGPPLGLLGLMALDQRRTEDGIDTLRLALARDWRDQSAPHASAWSNLSVGYLSARRYAEARDAAARALQLDPNNASAQHNLRLAEAVLRTIGAAPR